MNRFKNKGFAVDFVESKRTIAFLTGKCKSDPMKVHFDILLKDGANLQRPFCWTLQQKQELVLSVFLGKPIPQVAYFEVNHEDIFIMDGKQRISAALGYIENEFPIVYKGETLYFKDLYPLEQNQFLTSSLVTKSYSRNLTDAQKIEWFLLLNHKGTAMDSEHLAMIESKIS
jgi:uncharacterized protein with ParB-like and HNH nuclease domain